MEIKKSFYIIFFIFLYCYSFNLFAQKPNDAIEPFCNSNLKGVNTSNLYLENFEIKITTIARGVSVGNELEYTDEVTLGRSIVKRILFENSIKNIL